MQSQHSLSPTAKPAAAPTVPRWEDTGPWEFLRNGSVFGDISLEYWLDRIERQGRDR